MRVIIDSGERGAVAVIVGILVTVLFGFAALAVDVGNLWASRRQLVTATDAAVLAATQSYAEGENGCTTVAGRYVDDNYAEATVTGCTVSGANSGHGVVTVAAKVPVDYQFAGVIGVADPEVPASSTASWHAPSGVTLPRPFGLCEDHPAVKAWMASPRTDSAPVKVMYGKSSNDDCGSASGNWGVLDFDGGSNGTGDVREWTLEGYDGIVRVGDTVDGNPGAFSNSLGADLDDLIAQGGLMTFPLFDSVTGNGSIAEFRITGFVSARLVSYEANGSADDRYFEVQFLRMVVSGECCVTGPNTGTYVLQLCDADRRFGGARC